MNSHTRTWMTLVIFITFISNAKPSKAETEPELVTNIDEALNGAFEALSRAEGNGAQINELISELNEANLLYQELKTAFKEGDAEKATIAAQECARACM